MNTAFTPLPDRAPVVSGRFYPASREELKSQISDFLERSARMVTFPILEGEELRALVVPHAGYVFSGTVAASAYNLLKKISRKTVFLIGSSHHAMFDKASVYYSGSYTTPLGDVSVDREIAEELLAFDEVFSYYPEAHLKEHCLEVQLPFLQMVLSSSFRIIPIIIGSQSEELPKKIAEVLTPYFRDASNLFVISTDLSHYPAYNEAVKVDKATIDTLCENSPDLFSSYIKETEKHRHSDLATRMCGWTSALTLLYMTRDQKDITYKPVLYQNSGDIPLYGDKSHVVGYQSIAVVRATQNSRDEYTLDQEARKTLLDLAHGAIEATLEGKKTHTPKGMALDKVLSGQQGAFVSIYIDSELRGCIGRITTEDPLYDTIQRMAIAAATQDSRFLSVRKKELEHMKIEISVLTPLRPVSSPEEIIPGRHGILIRKGLNSGTFLPQVADKTGWDAIRLLEECSDRKAGLGKDGWRDAELFTYEAIVFSDQKE